MDKKFHFYGTPLNRLLDNEEDDPTQGPRGKRGARLNRQQTVRDEQGRQRFHGAFTGGFSAGYYNTVDSVEGFHPRQFISQRSDKEQDVSSKFSHRPEDYMDSEDLGEFGIAPRKIRVNQQYLRNEDLFKGPAGRTENALLDIFRPTNEPIGEKILKNCGGDKFKRASVHSQARAESQLQSNFTNKTDLHGLGYRPLRFAISRARKVANSTLEAVLAQGKRLKISGEAFGTGVLDDDDDDCPATVDQLGCHEQQNYEFDDPLSGRFTQATKGSNTKNNLRDCDIDDPHQIPEFVLAKNLSVMQLTESVKTQHSSLTIPNDWKEPRRQKPVLPEDPGAGPSLISQLDFKDRQSVNAFNKKFISASVDEPDALGPKVGLVSYADLKANASLGQESSQTIETASGTTISRRIYSWKPCSLLCKQFDVPDPYPDRAKTGILILDDSQPAIQELDDHNDEVVHPSRASMEEKRAIFNVSFCMDDDYPPEQGEESTEVYIISESDVDSEIKVEPTENTVEFVADQDIEIVNIAKKEPELIILSDCSSSASEKDAYGPPLPPAYHKTSLDTDKHHKGSRKSKKHKNKKHKRSRRDS